MRFNVNIMSTVLLCAIREVRRRVEVKVLAPAAAGRPPGEAGNRCTKTTISTETAKWKSMRQLTMFWAMTKDIEENVLKENKIKLTKGRKRTHAVKEREADDKGREDSKETEC